MRTSTAPRMIGLAKRAIYTCVACVLLLGSAAAARRIDGAELPERLEFHVLPLHLNGAGTRTKYLVDVYVAGLYLKQRSSDSVAIIAADEPMAVRLHVISRLITSRRLRASIREGFEISTGGNTEPFRDEIEALVRAYQGRVVIGDVFDVLYWPGKGVEVYKNGEPCGEVAAGLEFKRALFGVWLSERAVQADLKSALLGRN